LRRRMGNMGLFVGEASALCDLALRALAPPQIQEQAGETPRTDAALGAIQDKDCGDLSCDSYGHDEMCPYANPENVMAAFARQLERELQAHQAGASSGSPDAVQEQRSGNSDNAASGGIDQITATPRTDIAEAAWDRDGGGAVGRVFSFARQLERELGSTLIAAERYHWIRNRAHLNIASCWLFDASAAVIETPEQFDAAIDTFIALDSAERTPRIAATAAGSTAKTESSGETGVTGRRDGHSLSKDCACDPIVEDYRKHGASLTPREAK
jgi:hypothetical protein